MAELQEIKSGERLSFLGLFTDKELIIEVPIIQRDYAQGRASNQSIRNRFLDALLGYLDLNIPGRDLDFIYGSISDSNEKIVFIPLDGQQRLTTLFLMHWYLALIDGKIEKFKEQLKYKDRSRFTYETRASAREFCDGLILNEIHYEGYTENVKISQIIKNEPWYFFSWGMDPTVQSMLVMLDDIESKFYQYPEFYERLINLQNPVITFQFLNLNEFKLTDDLYIKMNSRGKSLTPFENFKAKFEQEINFLFDRKTDEFELTTNGILRKVSAHEYFSNRIDTVWLDYFWKIGGNNPRLVDTHLMNFIRVVLANYLAIRAFHEVTIEASNRPHNFRVLIDSQDARKKRETENLSYFDFLELDAINKESIQYLIGAFDLISKTDSLFIQENINSFHFDYDLILKKVLTNSLTAQERVKFHAFLTYLKVNLEELEGIGQWMRVVHNLAENHRIDDADNLISSLQGINQIAANSNNILKWLSSKKSIVGGFFSRQVEEEKVKALLILRDNYWEEVINNLEQSSFFNGQIGFILEFSGILDEYNLPGIFIWDVEELQEYFLKFSDYSKKASAIFNQINSVKNSDLIWERTVLTKGNYLLTASNNRLNFLHTPVNTRDYSWKRLLRLNRESEKDNSELTMKRYLVKEVFDDHRFDPNDVWSSCNEIITDGADDWRSYFIKNAELIRVSGHGFIRMEAESSIKLQTKTKLTYHYELRTLNFYNQFIKGNSFALFEEPKYWWAYGDSEHCCIYFGDWNYTEMDYQLKIFFKSSYGFVIEFSGKQGKIQKSQYSAELIEVLEKQGYRFDTEEWNGFYCTEKSENGLFSRLNKICFDLKKLNE